MCNDQPLGGGKHQPTGRAIRHPSSGRRHRSLSRHTRSAYPTDKLGTSLCCVRLRGRSISSERDGLYSRGGIGISDYTEKEGVIVWNTLYTKRRRRQACAVSSMMRAGVETVSGLGREQCQPVARRRGRTRRTG